MQTGLYTINQINENIYMQAHQTAARYPKDVSEFEATGLTEEYKDDFKAPFVKESIIKMGVRFQERIHIKTNNTIIVVGQIEKVYFPNNCLCSDGFVDIEKAGTITCAGLDSYHKTQRLERLAYAKPNKIPEACQLKYIE
ncbi:MAG: flavin reductase family protein [Sphingobacteriaceae bacterium]